MARTSRSQSAHSRHAVLFALAVLGAASCGHALAQDAALPFGLRGIQNDPFAAPVPVPSAAPQRPAGVIASGNPFETPEESEGRALPAAPEPPFPVGDAVGGPANPRIEPEQAGSSAASEENPFQSEGFRLGTWVVNGRIAQSVGYSSNASQAPGGSAGPVGLTEGSLEARSDWSRHAASVTASGSYEEDFGSDTGDTPFASIGGALRLDLFDGNEVNMRGSYSYTTESITTRAGNSEFTDQPGINNYEGEVGWLRGERKLIVGLRGSAERETYGDATTVCCEVIDQSDRNNTLYMLRGRAGYELSPALIPFVEVGGGKRVYDENADEFGTVRDADVFELRAGAALDLGEKLRGEISLVYLAEDFEDSALDDIGVTGLDANLVWSPWRGTEVNFFAETGFDLSTDPGSDSSISRIFGIEASRIINSRLLGKAGLGLQVDTYTDDTNDFTYTAGVGLEYAVNRYLRLTADADYEQFDGALSGSSWDAATVRVGAALER
jgi:hypothetical protein